MRPEDGLQKLRRRVHRPLATKAAFDANAGVDGPYKPVAYAIHADDADGPFERFVEGILREEGHRRTPEGEEPQHHVANLSNRSSAAWVLALANAHAGKLVFSLSGLIGAAMESLGCIPKELQSEGGDPVRSAWLVLAGATCFWLAGKGYFSFF